MADTKLADLTALTTPSGDDILYIVDDPAGTPLDRKIALDNLFTRGTVTADAPVLNMSQTWNNAAVTFTGLKFNATDTASAAASLLMDLQVGGTSIFGIRRAFITGSKFNRAVLSVPQYTYTAAASTGGFFAIGPDENSPNILLNIGAGAGIDFQSNSSLRWTNSASNAAAGTPDLLLTRRDAANLRLGAADAAAPVAQFLSVQGGSGTNIAGQPFTIEASRSTGTAAGGSILFNISPAGGSSGTAVNTPVIFGEMTSTRRFSLYNTFTDATTFERANIFWDSNVLKIGTEKGSVGGTARALEFQTDGVTRLTIGTSGIATFTLGVVASYLQLTNGSVLQGIGSTNGAFVITNSSVNDFNRLAFGGTTSAFPALKRVSANLQVIAADGTSSAGLIVGNQALSTTATDGFLYVPTCAGTPTGTPTAQTGTAPIVIDTTNDKLYFYSDGQWRDAGP
jgi:hypothetical protein